MSNILFVWEFGDHWGHLSRDLPIAKRLLAAGQQVLFAVCDTKIAQDILAPADILFVQAPMCRQIAQASQPIANHAEMLIAHGYAQPKTLQGLVGGWLGIFALFKPDVIVIDYAPTASLAARICDIPVMLTGSGFELPPLLSPLPAFRPWENISVQRLMLAESLALRNINWVLTAYNCQNLAAFAELFDAKSKILTTFKELDHFGERNCPASYSGPISELPKGYTALWPANSNSPRIFAYLRPGIPELELLLRALIASPAVVICVLPGATESLQQGFQTADKQMFPAIVALENLLPGADLVIGYGSGTIATSLLAGVPLLLTPFLTEQFLSALRVEALGAGLMVKHKPSVLTYSMHINKLLADSGFRNKAQQFAHKYQDFDSGRGADFIANSIIELLRNNEKPKL